MSRRTRGRFVPCEHNGQTCKPPSDIADAANDEENDDDDDDEEYEDKCSCWITKTPDGPAYGYCRHCLVHGDSVR